MQIITEGTSKIKISSETKISKKLEVFYNPVMKLNRDISILLLNSIQKEEMQIADPLAGTGIRSIRFLKELKKRKIKNLSINDYNSSEKIKENLAINGINKNNVFVYGKDANIFLLESYGFDYIDIDPFGSPNPFLSSSIIRLARGGILAVTATDTSALAGSSEAACIRKYWAKPLKNEYMHETGIRILIRKVQLIGAEYEKALTPLFSYAKDHYYRVFFRCDKGKRKVDELFKFHNFLIYNPKTAETKVVGSIFNKEKEREYAGPLWTGSLWDQRLVGSMYTNMDKKNKEEKELITLIREESAIPTVGFYDLHKLAKLKGINIPKTDKILKRGVARTHFLGWGIRSKKHL